jgi:hypothetical protein
VSALRAVWRFLASVPGIIWAAVFVLAFFAAAGFALYHHGRTVGETTVHRKTLTDSVAKTTIVHKLTVQQTDASRAEARSANRMADSARVIRHRFREAALPLLDSLPDPVVRLIAADDEQIARDSTALAAYVAVDTTWLRERAVSADLDTLRQHQVTLGPAPSKGHAARWFAGGFVVAVVLTFAVAAAR